MKFDWTPLCGSNVKQSVLINKCTPWVATPFCPSRRGAVQPAHGQSCPGQDMIFCKHGAVQEWHIVIMWCVWSFRPSSPLQLPHLKCLLLLLQTHTGSHTAKNLSLQHSFSVLSRGEMMQLLQVCRTCSTAKCDALAYVFAPHGVGSITHEIKDLN